MANTAVVEQGSPDESFAGNFQFVKAVIRMIVPGSTYWNVAFGREKGEVRNDTEGIADSASLYTG
ncbi:MAG: hypothetical protein WCJ35_05435 [Planctomycetota bacterium]